MPKTRKTEGKTPEMELDEWGDPIEDGDTVISLVFDSDSPVGLRPVLRVKGAEPEPEAGAPCQRQVREVQVPPTKT